MAGYIIRGAGPAQSFVLPLQRITLVVLVFQFFLRC